jgi:hypothetical protein
MTDEQKRALVQQLRSDPRIAPYLANGRSSAPMNSPWGIELNGTELRELGYDVPEGWNFRLDNGGTLHDEHDIYDTILPIAAGGIAAAGILPGLIGGGAAAASSGAGAGAGGLTPAMTAAAPAIASQGASAAAGGSGILGTIGNLAGPIGNILGDASIGLRDGRQQDNTANALFYNALVNGASDQYRAGAQNYLFERDAPTVRSNQTARGDLLANVQDLKIGRPAGSTIPTFPNSGGLRPSALGPNARQAGSEMSRQALLKLMEGEDLPQYEAPKPPTLDTGGFLEDFLGGAGIAGNIWDTWRNR